MVECSEAAAAHFLTHGDIEAIHPNPIEGYQNTPPFVLPIFFCNMGYRMNREENLTSIFMQVTSKMDIFLMNWPKFMLDVKNF